MTVIAKYLTAMDAQRCCLKVGRLYLLHNSHPSSHGVCLAQCSWDSIGESDVSTLFAWVSGWNPVGNISMRFSDVFSGSESAKKWFGFTKFSRVGPLAAGRVDRDGDSKGSPLSAYASRCALGSRLSSRLFWSRVLNMGCCCGSCTGLWTNEFVFR